LDESRNNFVAARVSLGAVAPKPLFIKEAGDSLAGKPVNAANIEAAAKIAQAAATPISDMRGTAEYRKHLSAVMARRAIEKAVTRARGI
jgi:carbon-monoxide dehydrogenase medium subunit